MRLDMGYGVWHLERCSFFWEFGKKKDVDNMVLQHFCWSFFFKDVMKYMFVFFVIFFVFWVSCLDVFVFKYL